MTIGNDHRLRHVNPLIYFICWGYVLTNQLIGLGIYHTPTAALSIYPFITPALNAHFYGILFMGMGIVGAISMIVNSWQLVRRVMMFGLAVKSLFFYGLLVNLSWQLLSIIGIWALITVVQFLTVVYFPRARRENGTN